MTLLQTAWSWSEPLSLRAERTRVSVHLLRAEQRLARAKTTALGPLQRLARALLLRELRRYREGQRFPQNLDFAEPTPYFVDAAGTRCAVAHLLDVTGEGALVQRVARGRNHARVRELTDEPRLVAWLAAAGLSLDEAAAIQPEYCERPSDCVCYRAPLAAVIETTALGPEGPGTVRVQVTAIHGSTSHLKVGDETVVSAGAADTPGTPILISLAKEDEAALDRGDPTWFSGSAVPGGTFHCNGDGLPIGIDAYVSAALSDDCAGQLGRTAKIWNRKTCSEGACSAALPSADAPPTSLGIVVALLALLVRRRARA